MDQEFIDKHEDLVVDLGEAYLNNMELELGKKYKDNSHEINASLSSPQYWELIEKYKVSHQEFTDLYAEFLKMKPTKHLEGVVEAFAASGGSVEIEPAYDEQEERLNVSVNYVIKDKTLNKIEGLTPIEDIQMKMNALIQIETVLSGSDSGDSPSF
ncbi:MAG: hypothetical protein ACWA5Q_11160 [bacterium]